MGDPCEKRECDRDRRECGCACHGTITVHTTVTCDCGKPVVCPPPKGPVCPPPKPKPQPGVVGLPQPPPYHPPTSPEPSGSRGRPPRGDPGTIPWFQGQVAGILRNGPTFGPRKDEYLPYLLIRASSGDRGARPFSGVFWESPDIFVTPGQDASAAPLMPATLGGLARAEAPNTLYAHVWNLGRAPAYRVRVEFYWCNPSLGISRADGNLVGAAWIDLGSRYTLYSDWKEVKGPTGSYLSRGCHAIVRCPATWVPAFVNGGHECLVVRASEPMFDAVSPDQFSPAADRHVGQRNISVVQASSPAEIDLNLNLGYLPAPADAVVEVELAPPSSAEWFQLLTGKRDSGFQPPSTAPTAGFLPPAPASSRSPELRRIAAKTVDELLRPSERFHRGCDPLQILFHARIAEIGAAQAQVLRVRQKADGNVVGGYTVILMGK